MEFDHISEAIHNCKVLRLPENYSLFLSESVRGKAHMSCPNAFQHGLKYPSAEALFEISGFLEMGSGVLPTVQRIKQLSNALSPGRHQQQVEMEGKAQGLGTISDEVEMHSACVSTHFEADLQTSSELSLKLFFLL